MKFNEIWSSRRALLSNLSMAVMVFMCLTACQDDFGGYFEQPGWVEPSSQAVLKSRSDCKTYMQLVNKTLFSKQIQGSGQYTFFVPTDEAFAEFFANNPYGYTSVDDIPDEVAARMVSSWMVYNKYPCDTLANVLSGFNTWKVNEAFKHQTPSYDVLREEVIDGKTYQMYEFPFSESSFSLQNNAPTWNNYRYLPVYTDRFNKNNAISSADWQKVVGSEFSPYGNYLEAGIIDAGTGRGGDLECQNGVIHLVNKVVMPLENMDALIRTYGDGSAVDQPAKSKSGAWSILRKILNHKSGNGDYFFYTLQESSAATHYFEKAYPNKDMSNFRMRTYYSDRNPFLLNCESYLNMMAAYAPTELFYTNYNGGMTFYVPETQVLLDYINNRLFKYIGVTITENTTQEEFDAIFNKLSDNVMTSLWRSMQADGMIWPSQFQSSAVNSVGSSEHINGYDDALTYESGVTAAGMASNAMWQITNFVPKTAAFEGIASRLLLDPAYGNEENILTTSVSSIYNNMLKSKLSSMDDVDVSMILWGNDNATWWDNIHYSTLLSTYATGAVGSEESVNTYYLNNVLNSYIERQKVDALDFEVDPLNGAYGGWAYTNNYAGGVMRYRKSGNMVDGKPEIQIQTSWSLVNDENEQALQAAYHASKTSSPVEHLQMTEPTEGSYASVVKDVDVEYVNGNIYTAVEHSVPLHYAREATFGNGKAYKANGMSTLQYLRAYLIADANSANPQHTLFKKLWDYYDLNKGKRANSDTINLGSSFCTIFVPTDAALQAAIDYGKTHEISLMRHPDAIPADPTEKDANWVDSVIYILNAYITKSGCYPDDGLSAFYEMSEAWDGLSASNRQAPTQYLVTTNTKIVDTDHLDAEGKVVKAWDGLLSGGVMSGYVAKTEGKKLQYFGRAYTSGAYQVVDVYNSNEMTSEFDNTVVREQGQSNIMCPNGMIHSLNGFIVYKIASRE